MSFKNEEIASPEPVYSGGYYDEYKSEFDRYAEGASYTSLENGDHPVGQSTITGCVWTMAKTIVGAGLFNLPSTMNDAGFVLTIFLTLVMVAITFWTIKIMLQVGHKLGVEDYADLVDSCFGRAGAIVYNLSAFVFAFGGCAAYCVVVGDTVPKIIYAMIGDSSKLTGAAAFFADRRTIIVLSSLLVLFPVSCYKQIHKLNMTSLIGLASVLFAILVIVIQGNTLPAEQQGPKEGMITVAKMEGFFPALGALSFVFVCHHSQFLLYKSLKQATLKRYSYVMLYALLLSFLLSMFVAIGGYVAFTSDVQENIINNLPDKSVLANAARAAFAIDMFLTFPIELYVARDIVLKSIHNDSDSNVLHYTYTAVLTGVACLLAVITSDISIVIVLTGGLAASVFAFILPPACAAKYDYDRGQFSIKTHWTYIICIIFGFGIMIMSTTQTIVKAVSSPGSVSAH